MDEKKRVGVKQFFKNLGTSSREMIRDFVNETELFQYLKDRKEDFDEWKERNKGDFNSKGKIKKITDNQIKNFWKWMDSDRMDGGSTKDDLKDIFGQFIDGMKTGNLNQKQKDEFSDLFDEDSDYLFSDEEDFDSEDGFSESFGIVKGVKMNLKSLKDEYNKKLRINTYAESLEELSSIPELNNKVKDISIEVNRFSDTVDDLPARDELIEEADFNPKYNEIKDDILKVINLVSTNQNIEYQYKDILTDALTSLFINKCQFMVNKDLPNRRDFEDIKKEKEEIQSSVVDSHKLSDILNDKLKEVMEVTVEQVSDNMPAPLPKLTQDDLDASTYTAKGEFVTIDAGISKLAVALVAVPLNLGRRARVNSIEKKYGSNFVFKQPMVVGDDISNDVASKFAKAMEVKQLIEMKGLIEATAAQMDGGSVVSRAAKSSKVLSPLNIELRNASLSLANTNKSYDEIISAFSESIPGLFNTPSKLNVNATKIFTRVAQRYDDKLGLYLDAIPMIGSGESGDFIEHRRNALPSYMEISIDYEMVKDDLELKRDIKTKKTTIGMQILPRKVDHNDICKSLLDIDSTYYKSITTTKDERAFIKRFLNIIKFWQANGNKDETAILKSNQFKAIIDKVKAIKNPLFHLVISYSDYIELKEMHKFDIMQSGTYKKIMKYLPLISIAIIDEDSDYLYLSEGNEALFVKYSVNDFIDTVAQYEKELKTILKYNQI